MKVLVLSDLHLEFGAMLTLAADVDYDAVVLAGDIQNPGTKAVHWARRDSTFGGKPVLSSAARFGPTSSSLFGKTMEHRSRTSRGRSARQIKA